MMGEIVTAGTGVRPRGAGRTQLHEVALRLFAVHGVEGTSLQAIADEMGVSKAAVYYHYKTKDDLVLGILAPLTEQLSTVMEQILARRGRQARLDAFITGLVDLALDNHDQFAMMLGDPAASRILQAHALTQGWADLLELVGDASEDDRSISVALLIFSTGLLSPLRHPDLVEMDRDALREILVDAGRRLLRIRRPASAE
jgi:AcrR family transcriptional regulator